MYKWYVFFFLVSVPDQPVYTGTGCAGYNNWYPDPYPSIPGTKTRPGFHTRGNHYSSHVEGFCSSSVEVLRHASVLSCSVCSSSLSIVGFEYAWSSSLLSFCSSCSFSSFSIVDVKYAWISLRLSSCSSVVSTNSLSVSVFQSSSSDSISSINGV